MEISLTLPARTVACLEENTDYGQDGRLRVVALIREPSEESPSLQGGLPGVLEEKAPGPARGRGVLEEPQREDPATSAAVGGRGPQGSAGLCVTYRRGPSRLQRQGSRPWIPIAAAGGRTNGYAEAALRVRTQASVSGHCCVKTVCFLTNLVKPLTFKK